MTRDASGPGICFCKLRNGHSPLITPCSFLVTIRNSISSWHFTISQWDFSHCLDPCKCLPTVTEACLWGTWHLPALTPQFAGLSQPLGIFHQGQEPSLTDWGLGTSGMISNTTCYWVTSLMVSGDPPLWKVQSFISAVTRWSLFTTFAGALSSTLNAWGSHGPVQPVPRVLR